MTDAPLFQNTDDQETAYAPQEPPAAHDGDVRGNLENGTAASAAHDGSVALPAASAGATYGTSSTANPGLGGLAIDAGRDDRLQRGDGDV